MKTVLQTLLLLGFISMNSQNYTLTDYNWTIEKIVTDEETLLADQEENFYDILYLQNSEINDENLNYVFSACDGQLEIIQSAQSFDLLLWGCAITPEHSDIALFFYNVYLSDESNEVNTDEGQVYGTFTYDFREENEIIYLDITNPVGSVATFSATTLSNENFNESQFAIYPNPVANELHIETDQAKIERIEIYTIGGKKVLDVNFLNDQPIDVSKLIRGLYLVKIETGTGSLTKKLVKK